MKIAFIWQGSSDPKIFSHWNDGLRAAMKRIESVHEVSYHEPYDDFKADLILYWEAPCTINGKDSLNYNRIRMMDTPKMLLFAGGPVQKEWVEGFQHIFVESKINADEFESLGVPHSTAFGINEHLFYPQKQPKKFDAFFPATSATWKRLNLFSKSMKENGVVSGRFQETDPQPFTDTVANGSLLLPELPYAAVAALMNASHTCVNTSDYWGGGQRATLEALACGTPVVAMSDSPKNREYVEESGAGLVTLPEPDAIRSAVEEIKAWGVAEKARGFEYVQGKWTSKHYADNLLKIIDA